MLAINHEPAGKHAVENRGGAPDRRAHRSVLRKFSVRPRGRIFDIDDTVDEVHGSQQLSFWNAHYDCRCFLPIHVYHVESGKPVT